VQQHDGGVDPEQLEHLFQQGDEHFVEVQAGQRDVSDRLEHPDTLAESRVVDHRLSLASLSPRSRVFGRCEGWVDGPAFVAIG